MCSVLVALLISVITFSQNNDPNNKESQISTIKSQFGFNLGADYSLAQNFTSIDTFGVYPSSIYNALGIRLGVFGDIKIQQRITLLPKAELSLNYTTLEEENNTYKLGPANLYFMFHGKINFSKRDKKVNPYAAFGPGMRVPLNSNKEGVYNTVSAWSGDISMGLDLDLNWFYLSPEIRFSHGLTNIKAEDSWHKIRGSYIAFNLLFTGK